MSSYQPPTHDPREWLRHYLTLPVARLEFFIGLIGCALDHDITSVIQCVPADIFEDFQRFAFNAVNFAAEDFFYVNGGPDWQGKDAQPILQWLKENPHPITAAAVPELLRSLSADKS